MEADLTMKEKTLAKLQQPSVLKSRYSASNDLLAFLESL
jgi:hypothetical protein